MGQAFDETGRVLGEASGATLREVLDKLEQAHPEAAEIRILRQQAADRDEQVTRPVDPMLQFFAYAHLPPHLAAISRPFCELAHAIVLGEEGRPHAE